MAGAKQGAPGRERTTPVTPANGLRILVPLDDSPAALRALRYAVALASATGGRLKLIRASQIEDQTEVTSLANYADLLQQAGSAVEWSVARHVDAPTAILDAARTWRPDLIAMETTTSSDLERWLNDSVTDAVLRAATVPVLVLPPDWERPLVREHAGRILVPLDGSRLAEQALGPAVRFASLFGADLILLRILDAGVPHAGTVDGVNEYLRRARARVEEALPGHRVSAHAITGSPPTAIAQAALDLHVDVMVMATHGRSGLTRAVLGSTATTTLEHSAVPLLLLGPHALSAPATIQIVLGAPVGTLDEHHVGEVHRVVLDLEQRAVVSVVVLSRGLSPRDVLVPIDFVKEVRDNALELRLTSRELAWLPDFAYKQFVTPPALAPLPSSPWLSGPAVTPIAERTRIGPAQQEVTRATRVLARDGEIGTVERIELDPTTGRLDAFWVRAGGIVAHDLRIPGEWIRRAGDRGSLPVAGTRAEIEAYLGEEGRAHRPLGGIRP